MTWDRDRGPDELSAGLDSLNQETINRLVGELTEHLRSMEGKYPETEARRILRMLRRRRHFEPVREIADALLSSGNRGFGIQQEYAQALLDLRQLGAAEAFLERMRDEAERAANDPALTANERTSARRFIAEARGLLGRRFKQSYVDSAAPPQLKGHLLRQAIDHYSEVYEQASDDPHRRWHGINSVALAMRAQRDQLEVQSTFDPLDRAEKLLRAVELDANDASTVNIWDCAIAMEACIALDFTSEPRSLGGTPRAVRWARRYVEDTKDIDAFEVASTRRQLLEVWGLDHRSPPGDAILPFLDARLLAERGGSIAFEQLPPDLSDIESEENRKHYGGAFVQVQSWLRGLKRAEAVARIGFNASIGVGTGFLVRGGDLYPAWGGEPVLMTNSHVVAEHERSGPTRMRPRHARVAFQFRRGRSAGFVISQVEESIWEAHIDELDVCILRLQDVPPDLEPIPLATREPRVGDRLFIIGHPGGGALSFSLSDNQLIAQSEDFLHHRLATAPGSSGSPVLDEQWRLVGLHHKWSPELPRLDNRGSYAASEAIRISAISEAIRTSYAHPRTASG